MAKTAKRAGSSKGRHLPAFYAAAGVLLILVVFVLALPVTAPRLLGYEVFNVVSGSMEPSIPVNSVIYVHAIEPEAVQTDDVIAFRDGDAVIAHRVVVNRQTMGEFVTKGDANNTEDLEPIPYRDLVGKVVMSLPFLGKAMALYASTVGKVYLALTFACGVMLLILAEQKRDQYRAAQLEEARTALEQAAREKAGEQPAAPAPRRRSHVARTILMGILAAIFICSAAVVGYVSYSYKMSDKIYGDAAYQYTRGSDATNAQVPPIQVDFEALQAVSTDVVGWLYCEDTTINYPVLLGVDNNKYLRHDYTGAYNMDGSIFIDCDCKGDFSFAKTIVYGHHMNFGAMFGCLEDWADQSYYDGHPVMWLLTPTQDYRIDLFSGLHTSAYSDLYQVIEKPGDELNVYLKEVLEQSLFTAQGVQLDPKGHYVMLSTCAYVFDNARFVLNGLLVPVPSEAGVPRT